MSKYTSKFTGAEIDGKLSKVNQEYTIGEKTKLAALENYDDSELVAAVSELETNKANKNDVYNKTETDNAITAKVAELVAGAPEEFDTLKEMSDWLTEHEDSAAAMNTAIQKNAADIANNKSAIESNDNDIAEVKNDDLIFRSTVGFQSKNILKNFTSATTKESAGITYEISDDGTVVCNGTTTSAHSYCYLGGYFEIAEENSFVLSGCPLGGSERNYALQLYKQSTPNDTIEINEYGDGYTKTLAKDVYQGVIVIRANQTVENLTFKPMLRLSGTDSTYTPYVPNIVDRLNDKLGKTETAAAAVLDGAGGNIAAQFASIYGLGTLIPSNSDLNDSAYIVPGAYRAASNAIATSLQNCPVQRGFRLEVREIIYSGIVVRTIYPHTPNGEFYMQYVTSDGFGKWYKFSGEEVTTSATAE